MQTTYKFASVFFRLRTQLVDLGGELSDLRGKFFDL